MLHSLFTFPHAGPGAPSRRVAEIAAESSAPPQQRLLSLDALRGFTMFWIIGGGDVLLAVTRCLSPAWGQTVAVQVTHPRWEGFVAWDLIMPTFLFVVGAALPFALCKRDEQGTPLASTYGRIFRRVVVLWLLGIIAQGCLFKYDLSRLELYSNTLQAIAVGYLVTAVALLHLPTFGQVTLFAALVLGYWGLVVGVPFGGHPAGTLEQTANLPRYVDEFVLGPFRRHHDFTWIVTSLGFAATVLLGSLAGQLLRSLLPAGRKLLVLTAIGVGCAAAGWLWSYWLPLNRHLWTSSLILWAGGWSCLLLALFYGVIDVAGIKGWAFPWIVIGANALLAYMFEQVFERTISNVLVANLARQWPAPYDELLGSIAEVGVLWLLLWYLYHQRTFLRA